MTEDETLKKQKLLSQSFIFEALDDQAKSELAAFAHMKTYAAGDVIFNQGDPGQSMMAIAEGTVRVNILTPTSRNITLAELHQGDVFGEIALLDGGERSADVRALSKCTLVVLERRSLLQVLNKYPALSIKLIGLLCERVRRSDERMLEIAFLDLPVRLARFLMRITVTTPGSPEKPLKRLSLSQSEIAAMIGNTRENVNRCLRRWQKDGLVELRDGWLILEDREAIEALADSA